MMALLIKNTALSLALIVVIAVLPTCAYPAYSLPAHPHGESGLATGFYQGTYAAYNAAFSYVLFGFVRVMARLEGIPSGMPVSLMTGSPTPSVLPPHLAMNGKTPNYQGVISHD